MRPLHEFVVSTKRDARPVSDAVVGTAGCSKGGPVTAKAPRSFNREIYHDHPEYVFYSADDGYQDGSFTEFAASATGKSSSK
jgi:hypothetical protein